MVRTGQQWVAHRCVTTRAHLRASEQGLARRPLDPMVPVFFLGTDSLSVFYPSFCVRSTFSKRGKVEENREVHGWFIFLPHKHALKTHDISLLTDGEGGLSHRQENYSQPWGRVQV